MKAHFTTAVAPFLVAVLAACAHPSSMELSDEGRARLGTTDVVFVVAQDEIYAEDLKLQLRPGASTFIGPALYFLPGVIISSPGKMDITIGPYRAALGDYDFPDRLRSTLQPALARSSLKIGEISMERKPGKEGVRIPRPGTTAGSTLILSTLYDLYPDYTAVSVVCDVTLLLHTPGQPTRTYFRTMTFSRGAPQGEGDLTSRWTRSGGAGLKSAIDADIADLAESLVKDIDRTESGSVPTQKSH